jgi:hypothetical protein
MKLLFVSFFGLLLLPQIGFAQKSKKITPPNDLVRYFKVKASDLTVISADVTGDGKPEYFVNNKQFCGNRCSTTLYQRKGKKFIVLFEIDTFLDVDEGWTEGYRNVVALDWFASVYTRSHYRWNGQEYVEFKCSEEERFGKNKGKIKQVPCEGQ